MVATQTSDDNAHARRRRHHRGDVHHNLQRLEPRLERGPGHRVELVLPGRVQHLRERQHAQQQHLPERRSTPGPDFAPGNYTVYAGSCSGDYSSGGYAAAGVTSGTTQSVSLPLPAMIVDVCGLGRTARPTEYDDANSVATTAAAAPTRPAPRTTTTAPRAGARPPANYVKLHVHRNERPVDHVLVNNHGYANILTSTARSYTERQHLLGLDASTSTPPTPRRALPTAATHQDLRRRHHGLRTRLHGRLRDDRRDHRPGPAPAARWTTPTRR